MNIIRYYMQRYENREAVIYKLIIALSTVALCIPFFIRYNKNYIAGGCAKDAVLTLMGRYVFPLVELICVVCYMRLAFKDNNQNIVIRYKSRYKIWSYQSIAGLIYSLECVLIIYITAILSGMIFFGTYSKWLIEGSYFYGIVNKYNWPLKLAVSEPVMYMIILSVKMQIISCIINIVQIINYISDSMRISILMGIIMCIMDYIKYCGVCGILDINLVDLYSVRQCILKIVIAAVSNGVLFLTGLYISKFREYYSGK